MVLMLAGSPEHGEHMWIKSGISICIYLHRKRPILLHTCAASSELPSYLSTRRMNKIKKNKNSKKKVL